MDLKSIRPKLLDFRTISDYMEWLYSHSDFIPEKGEILIVKYHDINDIYIKVGNGVKTFEDLPRIVP